MVSAVAAVNEDLVMTPRPLADYVTAALSQERLVAMLSGFFGALALLLAGVGLYGVTSYGVERRRTEIGIRLALGADPGRVLGLVLSRVAWLVALGVAAGAIAGLWASRFIATLLFGLEPRDPWTFVVAALILAAVGALAAWLPALRASRTDPALVLRNQ
jgi:ABC-type antimicrobial peptide transport system permease subunit